LLQPRGTSSHACSFVPSAAVSHTSCRHQCRHRTARQCLVALYLRNASWQSGMKHYIA
jgi:hypothetical protein